MGSFERHGGGRSAGAGPLLVGFESARFVQSLYRVLVGRAASRAELERGAEIVAASGRVGLVATLLYGEEALARQVRSLYEQHLMRAATDAEAANGVAALRSGDALDKVIASIIATPEYARAAGADHNAPADSRLIAAVFADLLRRQPTSAEHAAALGKLAAEGPARLVLSILRGVEFRSHYIAQLYRHLLDRPARAEEVRPWITRGHTGIDLQKARVGVLASKEYFARWS